MTVKRKACRVCRENKPLEAFSRDRNRKDGRSVDCKACYSAYHKRRYVEAVDHDHETGAIRGFLCAACNAGIAYLGDTAEGVKRALEYLLKSKQETHHV